MPALHLGPLDSSILIGYLVLLAAIGWWAGRHNVNTADDYFLASRSIPWVVTAMSFAVSCISAITFIGTPAEGFAADYRYLLSNPGDIVATLFIAFVFLPHFQKLRVTSIYEAVAARLGGEVRTTCSAYFLLTRTMASTVRIVAIAKVLEVVTGGALSYSNCVILVVGGVLTYTVIGGGRAIAWTDTVQFALFVIGAGAALTFIINNVPGGIPTIIEQGRHALKPDGSIYNKFNFLEMYKPENIGLMLLMMVWAFFNSSAVYGTDQDMVQRLLACNNNRGARWSLLAWGLFGIPIVFTFLSIGVSLYAYSQFHPEFIAGMTDPDHVFPRFILSSMPEGLRGLLLAAIVSAAMGSADSALASLATSFTVDFYKPFWGRNAGEAQCVRVSKLSVIGFGVLFVFFALWMRGLDRLLWLAFRLIAFTYGPLLGVFAVAIMTDWRIPSRKLIALMLSTTLIFFGLAMSAWWMTTHGGSAFWVQLHKTYWRLYIIFGPLIVAGGAYLMREREGAGAIAQPALGRPTSP